MKQHGARGHARISPSGFKRVLACPGSLRLSEQVGVDRSSSYAAEGTLAHQIAEDAARGGRDLADREGEAHTVEGFDFTVDQDMIDAAGVYVAEIERLRSFCSWVVLEETVSLNGLWPEGAAPVDVYGHLDCAGYNPADGALYVRDYKHGAGVAVEVVEDGEPNPQLAGYALGKVLSMSDPVRWIDLGVIQPRAPHPHGPIRTYRMHVLDLVMWGQEVLAPAIETAMKPGGALAAGDHCRFCPAKHACPELRAEVQRAARVSFGGVDETDEEPVPPPAELTDAELGRVLDKTDMIEAFLDGVRAEACRRLEEDGDRSIPGWKLVPKRATRRWTDAETVSRMLGDAYAQDVTHAPAKIKSPAQIEKAVLPDDWARVQGFVDKSSSGTTLARDKDARAAVKKPKARDTFDAIDN